MKIEKAAVVGAGIMGSAIAQVLSAAGIEVILKDINQDFVERGLANIKRMYDSRVKKGTLTQTEADYLFADVKGTTDYSGFENVDLVIEAVPEIIEVKRRVFKELDSLCPDRAILASNTSALSISEIAAITKRPEKVLGMHFFNPAQTMRLVEIIPGVRTTRKTTEIVLSLCRELNKLPVRVEECPGFLVNRLLFRYLNEALYVLPEGQASLSEIDKAAVQFGLPMGPFRLLDMTGIDVCLQIIEFLFNEYGPRFEPAPLLKLMVEKQFLGQKSLAGFYLHTAGQISRKEIELAQNPALETLLALSKKQATGSGSVRQFDASRIILPMFNEALYAIQEKVAEPLDVDVAMQWGCGLTRGLMSLAQEKGLDWCLAQMQGEQAHHGERFRPSWLLRKLVRGQVHDFKALESEPVATF